ncbi:MAG: ISL3 family transposase [Pyrinomonadaceae bacterium]|nr:ISL3 family transposase [Pyrinomonadaceae bacterium]
MWRHLDLGGRVCRIRLRRRRLRCPEHGVLAEGCRSRGRDRGLPGMSSRWWHGLSTRTDKTTICAFARIGWRTVGVICARVADEMLDPDRLSELVDIGVDEISWKKHHNYLTLVSNHETGKIVWGAAGKDTETLNTFFNELPDTAAEKIESVSMDLSPAYAKSIRTRVPRATVCFDPLACGQADHRRAGRGAPPGLAVRPQSCVTRPSRKSSQGARWALLKNPINLTEDQDGTLREIKRSGGVLWRAYQLKEALRAVFAGDLDTDTANTLLDRWCSQAQRSRIPEFIKAARTIRKHKEGITAALDRGLSNGRQEG